RGQPELPRRFWGGPHLQKPHGSRQKRHETPPARRWQRDPAGRAHHGGEPERVAAGPAAAGRRAADPTTARRPAAPAEGLARGPAVRHAAQPRGAEAAAHRGPPGAAADASRQRPGEDPLRGGTGPGLGRASPAPQDSLRAPARAVSSVPFSAPRPHPQQGAAEGLLKWFLSMPLSALRSEPSASLATSKTDCIRLRNRSSRLTTDRCPFLAAQRRGVHPPPLSHTPAVLLRSAPLPMRYSANSALPDAAALCKSVKSSSGYGLGFRSRKELISFGCLSSIAFTCRISPLPANRWRAVARAVS